LTCLFLVQVESEAKETAPKSPSFLTKLLGTLKVDKLLEKAKVPKSPKKEKKKEEVEVIPYLLSCLSLYITKSP